MTTLYITNQLGAQHDLVFNLTGSYTFYYAPGQTGTWNWYAEKYGYNRQTNSFTPATGGTITVAPSWTADNYITQANVATVAAYTSFSTLDQMYDYSAYFRTQNPMYVICTALGDTLSLGSTNLIIDATASSVCNYNSTTNTVTIKSSALGLGSKFTKISTSGTITTVHGASITCIYTTNAGTSTIFSFQNITAGSSLCVWDNAGTTKYFAGSVATDGTYNYYIAPGVTGTYYAAVEYYGKKRIEDTFSANTGAIVRLTPSYLDDVGIIQSTLATVQAYANVDTLDKLYDSVAAVRLTEAGIKFGQVVTREGAYVNIDGHSLVVDTSAPINVTLTASLITIKSNSLQTGVNYTKLIANPPNTVTSATTEVISAEFEDANGDSSLTIFGGSSQFGLWKVPAATLDADWATGEHIGDADNTKFRFLHADGYKIVVHDLNSNINNHALMTKGIYTVGMYYGDQIQLAQNPIITVINTKVDALQTDLDNIKGTGFVSSKHSLSSVSKKIKSLIGLVISK